VRRKVRGFSLIELLVVVAIILILMAIAILVPLYVAFFLLALAFGETWSTLGLVAITFLGQYAVYRARRYRLRCRKGRMESCRIFIWDIWWRGCCGFS